MKPLKFFVQCAIGCEEEVQKELLDIGLVQNKTGDGMKQIILETECVEGG